MESSSVIANQTLKTQLLELFRGLDSIDERRTMIELFNQLAMSEELGLNSDEMTETELSKIVIRLRKKLHKENSVENKDKLKKQLNKYEIELQKYEDTLMENPQRFVIFPIQYQRMWDEYYKKAEGSFWTAEEITLHEDRRQWESHQKLSDDDKHYIKHVLAFFASFDGIVNENLASNFMIEVQMPEARSFYGFQIAIENIHGEVYSLLIDTLITDQLEKQKLFQATQHFPAIKKLADWALRWLHKDRPFNQRLIAFACIEGILFSGPFCSIFWLKKRGLLPGLTFSNELISRDENLHMEFACYLNSTLKYKAEPETITEIVVEAVAHEKEFINESLPCNLIGMNASEMSKYIEYVADRLLIKLGVKPHWETSNPFEWMDLISLPNKTNFFEKRVGEYNRAQFNNSSANGVKVSEGIEIMDEF